MEFIFYFLNVSNFYWKLYAFKIKILGNFLSAFVILAGLRSAEFKYLTKIHLNQLLSPIS